MGKIHGLTLDLTRIPTDGVFVLEDLIVHEVEKPPKPLPPKVPFPDWLSELYRGPCAFCGVRNERMHFDHINMFDKTECVCEMMYSGCSQEEVLAEVAKCQLLCVPCHTKVTCAERKYGFLKHKLRFNKRLRAGEDVEARRLVLKADYAERMGPVYERLRGRGAREVMGV